MKSKHILCYPTQIFVYFPKFSWWMCLLDAYMCWVKILLTVMFGPAYQTEKVHILVVNQNIYQSERKSANIQQEIETGPYLSCHSKNETSQQSRQSGSPFL